MEIQTKFNIVIKTILRHEGGFVVDRPHDRGGPTNYGISLAFLKANNIDVNGDGVIDVEDIRSLSQLKAIDIYKEYFWDKYQYEKIDSIDIAQKIFDLAVNMGPTEAHKITQRTVNALIDVCGHAVVSSSSLLKSALEFARRPVLIIDGVLGPNSIAAINQIIELGRVYVFIEWFDWEAKCVYHEIVKTHPEQEENLRGWLARLKH